MAVPTRPIARRISRSPVRPIARGVAGFDPVRDLGDQLAFYHDLRAADSAYETLPGNTLATDQNDGLGAVLDLKRYKERGPELVTIPEIQGTPISSPGSTVVDQLYPTGATVEAGKLYEIKFSVSDFDGVSTVGVTGVLASPVIGVTRLIADGTAHGLFVALAGGDLSMFTRSGNTARFFGISVREVPGYHAIQDLAAAQPVLNIEGGIRSARADGVDDRLVIPNSTDQFNFLHDGTGGELHACARVTDMSADRMLVANNSGSSAGAGIDLRIRPNGVVRFAVTRGIAGEQSALNLPAGSAVAGEIAVWGIRYDAGTLRIYKNGVEAGAAAQSYPPVAADAQLDLTIGGPSPASGTFLGDIYSIAPVQGILSDYQRQRLASYMLRRAGA